MKTSTEIFRSDVQLGLLTTIFIFAFFGCNNLPVPQGIPTSAHPDTSTMTPEIMFRPLTSEPELSSPSLTDPPNNNDFISQTTPTPSVNVISEIIGQVDKDRTLADLLKLTGEEPICTENGCYSISNRLTGSKDLVWVKDYIRIELTRLGYSIESLDWSRSGYADQNLVVRMRGKSLPNEEVYFVAHMDGAKTVWKRQFPAADDNASGVVDLLELARVLNDYSFNRTVVLLFSTGEEQGTLGVKSYISQLTPEELGSIKYVVNVDMVGYDANHDWVMELWHGGHSPSVDLAELFSDTIKDYQLWLVPKFVVGCG